MPKNDENGFDSLFDDVDGDSFSEDNRPLDEQLSLNEDDIADISKGTKDADDTAVNEKTESARKRTSNDFEPDMDALLITAQSSLIIEGMKYLTQRNFASQTHLF